MVNKKSIMTIMLVISLMFANVYTAFADTIDQPIVVEETIVVDNDIGMEDESITTSEEGMTMEGEEEALTEEETIIDDGAIVRSDEEGAVEEEPNGAEISGETFEKPMVVIYFNDTNGKPIAIPDSFFPDENNDTYYAPNITGYDKPEVNYYKYNEGDSQYIFVYKLHVYMEDEDKGDSLTVTINYKDDKGNTIKESNIYTIELYQLYEYYAPPIEGFVEPENNVYSVTAFKESDSFEHTFVYTRYIPDGTVNIPDENLRKSIKNALGLHSEDITVGDMERLVNLSIQYVEIVDFTGIEYATNLKNLILRNNRLDNSNIDEFLPNMTSLDSLEISNNILTDLGPLAGLTQLKNLTLSNDGISDISILANLVNLESIELSFNKIVDITALSNLTNLKKINLYHNVIDDIEILADLVNLNWLRLENNRIDFDIEPNKTVHEFLRSNLVYYQFGFQDPVKSSTVTIHYQDDKGNTIKETDVITKRGDSYYIEAPIIEGYTVVSNGVKWFSVLYNGEKFEYTIIYKEMNSIDPKATVYIYYSDEKGMDIKSGDIYTDVTGTQTYKAPEIDGFIKPDEDTVTFTVVEDNQLFIHVFYYAEIPKIIPKATVIIKYVDNEGNAIKNSDVYTEITGTQTYTAPEIEGFIKPDEDLVTFTVTTDGEALEHTFTYTKIPKTTIIIYYVDSEGKTIKSSDVYKDITGTQTFTAPEIEGYTKPAQATYTYTGIQYYSEVCYTFVYTKTPLVIPPVDEPAEKPKDEQDKPIEEPEKPIEKSVEKQEEQVEKPVEKPEEKPVDVIIDEPTEKPIEKPIEEPIEKSIEEPIEKPVDKPIVIQPIEKAVEEPVKNTVITVKTEPRAQVIINYQDIDGNTLIDSDIYYNVEGTNTYIAPIIDGYTKTIDDIVNFTVTADGQIFEHTFIYSKDIQPLVIKGTIKVRYLLDGQLIDSDEFMDLDMGSHIIKAKNFDKYRLISDSEKEVILTEDKPNKTIEFELGIIPKEKAKLPVVPISTAAGGLFIAVVMMKRKKNLKIYAVEEASGDEVERLLSKRKVKVHSDEVSIDIGKELVEITGKKLKIVLNRSLSVQLLNKKLIFKNNNNYFGEITLIKQTKAIEITNDNVVSIIQK